MFRLRKMQLIEFRKTRLQGLLLIIRESFDIFFAGYIFQKFIDRFQKFNFIGMVLLSFLNEFSGSLIESERP